MDLTAHLHRLVAACATGPVRWWRRITWQSRIAISASCLLIVVAAIVSWIPSIRWAAEATFFIWIPAVLVWLVRVLSRWRHLSWAARLFAIFGVFATMQLAIAVLLTMLGQQPLARESINITTRIIQYTLYFAGLAYFEHELAKVTAAPAARVLVPFAIAFLYLFPPILVFLATNGGTNTFRLAAGFLSGQLNWVEALGLVCLATVPSLLIVIPEIMRRKLARINASALINDMVPKELAASAALATGLYVLTLHFYRGPLAHVSTNQLLFAIVAVALLLGPFYKSIASVCWEKGVATAFNPTYWLIRPLTVINEIRKVLTMPVGNLTVEENSDNPSIHRQADHHQTREPEEASTGQLPDQQT